MLLISDNFKHWSFFSSLTVLLRSLASSDLPVLSLWLRNNYKQETGDLPLGFERQQMLGISLNTLEASHAILGLNTHSVCVNVKI